MKKAGKAVEYDPKDNEVIHLLKKLKESNGAYPPEMLASRRQGYLKQVAEVSAGIGLAAGLRNTLKSGGKAAGSVSSTAGTVVEALLVIAILAEAGAVTYFYRNKIADIFQSITNQPRVEEVASPPVLASPITELQFTSTPVFTNTVAVTETGTLTLTPEGTPSPELAAQPTQQNTGSGVNTTGATGSTGVPGSSPGGPSVSSTQPANEDNGNHYGQTPLPERTKDPGNNTSSNTEQSSSTSNNTKKKP